MAEKEIKSPSYDLYCLQNTYEKIPNGAELLNLAFFYRSSLAHNAQYEIDSGELTIRFPDFSLVNNNKKEWYLCSGGEQKPLTEVVFGPDTLVANAGKIVFHYESGQLTFGS